MSRRKRKLVTLYAVMDGSGWVWEALRRHHEARGYRSRWEKSSPKMGPWRIVRCVELTEEK